MKEGENGACREGVELSTAETKQDQRSRLLIERTREGHMKKGEKEQCRRERENKRKGETEGEETRGEGRLKSSEVKN